MNQTKPALASLYEVAIRDVYKEHVQASARYYGRYRTLEYDINIACISLREYAYTVVRLYKPMVARRKHPHLYEGIFTSQKAFEYFLDCHAQPSVDIYKTLKPAHVNKALTLNDEVEIGMVTIAYIVNGIGISDDEAIAYVSPGQSWQRVKERPIREACKMISQILGIPYASSYRLLGKNYADRNRLRKTV